MTNRRRFFAFLPPALAAVAGLRGCLTRPAIAGPPSYAKPEIVIGHEDGRYTDGELREIVEAIREHEAAAAEWTSLCASRSGRTVEDLDAEIVAAWDAKEAAHANVRDLAADVLMVDVVEMNGERYEACARLVLNLDTFAATVPARGGAL